MQSLVVSGVRLPYLKFVAGGSDNLAANKSCKDVKLCLSLVKGLSVNLSLSGHVAVNAPRSWKVKVSTQDGASPEDVLGSSTSDDLKSFFIEQGPPLVKVKFVLEKRCKFGQQFGVVGDDLQFGSWDAKAAIPLEWSEGDIWTTEVIVPVGKQIEYKFILRGRQEEISWQPGPNQMFETSESVPSIVVSSKWEKEESLEAEKKIDDMTSMEIAEQGIKEEIPDSNLEESINLNLTSPQGAVTIQTVDVASDMQNGVFGVSTKNTEDKVDGKEFTVGLSGTSDALGPSNGKTEERGLFDSSTS